jgi:hypothetical protein
MKRPVLSSFVRANLRALAARLLGLGLGLGCGGDNAAGDAKPDAAAEPSQPDAGSYDDEEAAFMGCPDTTPAFSLGMQAKGRDGHIVAALIEASNAPPLRFLNDWTIELRDAAGTPLSDVSIKSARPFMPVHGHDGNVQPTVKPLAAPGRFAIDSLNFNMRGPWEIQLSLHAPSVGDDYVVFQICVAE